MPPCSDCTTQLWYITPQCGTCNLRAPIARINESSARVTISGREVPRPLRLGSAYMGVYLGTAALSPCSGKGWHGRHDQRRAWPGALAARAAPDARRATWQKRPRREDAWRTPSAREGSCCRAGSQAPGPPAPPAAAGQVIGPDSRGRQIRRSSPLGVTLSNGVSGIHGASCALMAGERLHEPVHENDKMDRR